MILGAVNSLIQARKQQKEADKINPIDQTYEVNPFVKGLYGEGRNLYQGRMAGAAAAEQNIFTNQANTNAAVGRNAGDSATALAIAAGLQGQTNQALANLGVSESQDKQRRFGIFSDVTGQMVRENDKVYEDKLRKYYDDLNRKNSLEGASMQNKAGFWGGLDNVIGAGLGLALPGGPLSGMFGGGNNNNNAAMGGADLGRIGVDPSRWNNSRRYNPLTGSIG